MRPHRSGPADLPDRKHFEDNTAFITACIRRLDQNRKRPDPETPEEMKEMQRRLYYAGRHDVALGRLFEGHVDAMQILHRYADGAQRQVLESIVASDPLLGVWNAEAPGLRVQYNGTTVSGGKSYASGAGILSHALVTSKAGTPEVQLHVLDLAQCPPDIDRTWWSVTGMARSETHQVRWTEAETIAIGAPGDYEREPWFSGGAVRFATVQAGGLAGLLDVVRAHLLRLDRAEDTMQQRRLAELHMLSSIAAGAVLTAGQSCVDYNGPAIAGMVANTRNIVYDSCERGIAIAQQACGTVAYFEESAVCRFAQDLGMYIRQPGPDAQLAKVGQAVAEGTLDPWPCGI